MMQPADQSIDPTGAYHAILGILVLIVVGLVAAELVRHKRRVPALLGILTYTYTEFLLLGCAIGPVGLKLIQPNLLRSLDPFLHLSLGSAGLLFGLQFRYIDLRRFAPSMYALTFFQAFFTFGLCTLAFLGVASVLKIGADDAVFFAVTLGTIASVSAPQVVAHLIHEQQARGNNAHLLQFITGLDALFGVLVLELLVGARTEHSLTPWRWLDAPLLLALSAVVGVICGLVFHWLTVLRTSVDEMVLYLLGLVILTSGVAATLDLSPLFANVVFGITVANLSRRVEETFRQMGRLEKPLFLVLLLLAGARWQLPRQWAQWVVPLILTYLALRLLGKWLGCLIGRACFRLYFRPVDRLGMALMSQGGFALALVISLSLVEAASECMRVIETVVILAIMASEFLAPPMVRHVLARGGEWRTPE